MTHTTPHASASENRTPRNARLLGSRNFLFLIALSIAAVGFVAGTRQQEIMAGISQVIGVPKSSDQLDLSSVQTTYQYLKANFDGDIDTQKLIDGANSGLVAGAGDKYTVYLTPNGSEELQKSLDGDIGGGIGAEIGVRNDKPTAIRILDDNPAKKAGLQKGDVFVTINDEKSEKFTAEEAAQKIRGKIGTSVKLEVRRGGELLTFNVVRAQVNNPSVQTEIKDKIGILTISRFDGQTGVLARRAAENFKRQGVNGVILDLRGDGGGYLQGSKDVASLWLNDKVVVTQRKNGVQVDELRSDNNAVLNGIKTVVLVDEGSASASEIVAGALRDHGAAKLVGQKTFGKGSVQEIIDIGDGAQLKVTVAKWFTPKGITINDKGFVPDTSVELTKKNINNDKDPQLDEALKQLRQ
jgi:carboxyl-terminal processing protease